MFFALEVVVQASVKFRASAYMRKWECADFEVTGCPVSLPVACGGCAAASSSFDLRKAACLTGLLLRNLS